MGRAAEFLVLITHTRHSTSTQQPTPRPTRPRPHRSPSPACCCLLRHHKPHLSSYQNSSLSRPNPCDPTEPSTTQPILKRSALHAHPPTLTHTASHCITTVVSSQPPSHARPILTLPLLHKAQMSLFVSLPYSHNLAAAATAARRIATTTSMMAGASMLGIKRRRLDRLRPQADTE